MRATIRRPDGTTIEAEGTPEEIAKLAGVEVVAPHVCAPCTFQPYVQPTVQPAPWQPWITFGTQVNPTVTVCPNVAGANPPVAIYSTNLAGN